MSGPMGNGAPAPSSRPGVDWKAAGLKRTPQREVVLGLVQAHAEHPTAEWIFRSARREIPGISLATVYRTLRLLKEKGLLLEFSGGGYPSRYDVTLHDHEHVRCVACGAVADVDLPEARDIRDLVANRTHFRVCSYPLVFHGLCVECEGRKARCGDGRGDSPVESPPGAHRPCDESERFGPEGSW